MPKKKTASELNTIRYEAVQAFQPVYSEMKSNGLIVAGMHYTRKNSRFYKRLREFNHLSEENRIRITKNHLGKIISDKINSILTYNPGVMVSPKNQDELQDQKDAELSQKAWKDHKESLDFDTLRRQFASDLYEIGEIWAKIIYNPLAGSLVDYEPKKITTIMTEQGPIRSVEPDYEKPIFDGIIEVERIAGYDVWLHPGANSISESTYIGTTKLVLKEELEDLYKTQDMSEQEEEQLEEAIKRASSNNYQGVSPNVDTNTGRWLVAFNEIYYRPCKKYPGGYFYHWVDTLVLADGELQRDGDGEPIFPIIHEVCKTYQGSSRGYSPIKQGRPLQFEINRMASKAAETQQTVGDAKVITTGPLTEGDKLAGIRVLNVRPGQQYQVLDGKSGSQFTEGMNSAITELYSIMGAQEDASQKQEGGDILNKLYQSLKQKKAMVLDSNRFENFLKKWATTVLKLSKGNYTDQKLAKIFGKCDQDNIPEFRANSGFNYDIVLEPVTDDIDTVMAKHLSIRDKLQYVGQTLDKEQLGQLILQDPFVDTTQLSTFANQTSDINNIVLALDRGEMPFIGPYQKHEPIVQALESRMNRRDFKHVIEQNPKIYENYVRQIQERDEIVRQQMEALRDAEAGNVPTSGPLVKADYYVNNPVTGKVERALFPQDLLEWARKKAFEQNARLGEISNLSTPSKVAIMGNDIQQNDPNNVVNIKESKALNK